MNEDTPIPDPPRLTSPEGGLPLEVREAIRALPRPPERTPEQFARFMAFAEKLDREERSRRPVPRATWLVAAALLTVIAVAGLGTAAAVALRRPKDPPVRYTMTSDPSATTPPR